MFGLIDILASLSGTGVNQTKSTSEYKRHIVDQPGDTMWVCFLPWHTDLETAQKYNLLPKNGKLVVYEVPDDLIASDPNVTKAAFDKLIKDFEGIYENESVQKNKLIFLGFSVGSMPAFYLANRYPCEKLIAVCATDKLGEGIYQAFAAREIKKAVSENGFDAATYDEVLAEANPIKNIDNLPQEIIIHISFFDKFIPFSGAKKLISEMNKMKQGVTVHRNWLFGHMLTLVYFGIRSRSGFERHSETKLENH